MPRLAAAEAVVSMNGLNEGDKDVEEAERTLLNQQVPENPATVTPAKCGTDRRVQVLAWAVSVTVVFVLATFLSGANTSVIEYVPSGFFAATSTCPDWFGAMSEELRPWKEKGGIDLVDLEAALSFGSNRFQIINGSLYSEHISTCWQTRQRYSIWGLLMFLRHFGSAVPDVDFVFNCGDMPRAFPSDIASDPIPALWGYNRQEGSVELTLPDWSFWGWPEVEITRWQEHGKKIMDAGRRIKKWTKRKPKAFWKGNVDVTAGLTDGLRHNLTACTADPANGVEAHNKDWRSNAFDDTRQWEQCGWRYRIYAEGFAWSVSMKYGMACGAVMLVIDPFFSAFYHPGLHYGTNTLLVQRVPLCESFREQITWADEHPAEAEAIGQAGLRFVAEDLSMARVYDYMLHKFTMYADLQTFVPRRGARSVLVTEADILGEASDSERGHYLVEEHPSASRPACILQTE